MPVKQLLMSSRKLKFVIFGILGLFFIITVAYLQPYLRVKVETVYPILEKHEVWEAIFFGKSVEEVEKAIEENPDLVSVEGPHGSTPLAAALLRNRPDIVRLLLKHGVDPKESIAGLTVSHDTASEYAKDKGYLEIYEILMDAESDEGVAPENSLEHDVR